MLKSSYRPMYKEVERIVKASKKLAAQVIRDLIWCDVAAWRQRQAHAAGRGLGALAGLGTKGPSDLTTVTPR